MQVVEEYLKRAEDCRRLASKADVLNHRQTIERVAATWENLAAERLKYLKRQELNAKRGRP
jgi:hypothetical protein